MFISLNSVWNDLELALITRHTSKGFFNKYSVSVLESVAAMNGEMNKGE